MWRRVFGHAAATMLQDWKNLLNPDIESFIEKNKNLSAAQLMLKGKAPKGAAMADIAVQVAARQKAAYKLPQWAATPHIIYASALSMEQCSSQAAAQYKASLAQGATLLDLTGGMGVDCFYLSQSFQKAVHIEQQAQLSEITAHNFKQLGATHIQCISTDSLDFLEKYEGYADLIYLDPARRNDHQQKVFRLADCQPNVADLLPILGQKTCRWLLKLSPMLDLKEALAQLPPVQSVHIVTVDNECKELLFLIDNQENTPNIAPPITAVHLRSNDQNTTHTFTWTQEAQTQCTFAPQPLAYLYEPHVGLLKAGAFRWVAAHFGLQKLHPDSHLYTSDALVANFAGRIFRCNGLLSYDKRAIKQAIPTLKANVSTRNFPDSVAQIRKKTGLTDGGAAYVIGTTLQSGKPVLLLCEKVV